jgi:hypothetical protein
LAVCVDEKERARQSDFRQRWQDSPDEVIKNHPSALAFMDAKGLRFNLPAYMRFAVFHFEDGDSDSIDSTIYAVSREPQDLDTEWAIFSERQKTTIAKFLRYMVLEARDLIDSQQASHTYERVWKKYDDVD